MGKFDVALGLMDLCVCDGCVTLPADVGTVLGVDNGGQPTLMRDQWFQFHANGPGIQQCVPWNYTDEMGPVVTFRDPAHPVMLVAEVESALDSNCSLRVFGWDKDGKRIYTPATSTGILEDGFLVPTVFGFSIPNPDAPAIARIDRIQKAATNGFVKLIAVDQYTGDTRTTIGYYQPWETVPSYRRIRVGDRSWLRIKYRRKDLEVRGTGDWINIDNRQALLLLLKSVKFSLDNQLEQAQNFQIAGMKILSDEAESLRPPAISGAQIIFSEGIPAGECDRMFY